ncbi:MAG: hypothetical protein ACJ72F_00325, partial [Nitrososphaeraceae archaeon]
ILNAFPPNPNGSGLRKEGLHTNIDIISCLNNTFHRPYLCNYEDLSHHWIIYELNCCSFPIGF